MLRRQTMYSIPLWKDEVRTPAVSQDSRSFGFVPSVPVSVTRFSTREASCLRDNLVPPFTDQVNFSHLLLTLSDCSPRLTGSVRFFLSPPFHVAQPALT